MSIPGNANPLLLASAAADAAAAGPIKSVRFNDDDSAYLGKTLSSNGNRRTYTISLWTKRGNLGKSFQPFIANPNSSGVQGLYFDFSSDYLNIQEYTSGLIWAWQSAAVYRDPNAWYHVVAAIDTTQATDSNRIKMYINGVQITDFYSGYPTWPTQNLETNFNNNTFHAIGRLGSVTTGDYYFDGYMADFYFIDGQQLDPTSFGAFDDNGVWQAAAYSGTFGTNGFHLFDFANESGIGNDSSGNDNDWTAYNLNNVVGNGNWISQVTATNGSPDYSDTYGRAQMFDNSTSTELLSEVGSTTTWTPTGGLAFTTFEIAAYDGDGGTITFNWSGGSYTWTLGTDGNNVPLTDLSSNLTSPLTSITWSTPTIQGPYIRYVEVDGARLIDNSFTDTDVLRDVPTNGDSSDDTGAGGEVSGNYATFNSLKQSSNTTLSNGNLEIAIGGSSNQQTFTTFGMSSGKWYCEFKHTSGSYPLYGISDDNSPLTSAPGGSGSGNSYAFGYQGKKWNDGTSATYSTQPSNGDIIGVAFDADNGTLAFYVNGTSLGNAYTSIPSGTYFMVCGTDGTNSEFNAGQYGFAYSAPSGYKALNTASLSTPTIADGSDYFDVKTWDGNGSTQSITGLEFSPDWVWIKSRSNSRDHALYDTVRGATKELESQETQAESTESTGLTAFNSDGFSLGNRSPVNASGESFVSWNWDAGANSSKTFTVKVVSDSGNKYRFDDFGTSAVTLDLEEGSTYVFDQSDSSNSGHPLRFSTTSDGTHNSGTEYTTGVTTTGTPGSAGAKTTIVVAASAPTLYYYCSVHSGMGGQANTNSTAGASNFDGSVQATVRANQTAGFSIVNYVAENPCTVGHGLNNAVPEMIIVKNYTFDGGYDWYVYHKYQHSTAPEDNYLKLNDTSAIIDTLNAWNDIAPTSSVFSVRGGGTAFGDESHIAYCMAPVANYSQFGVYEGNGSGTDGPFVFLNFAPAFLLVKRTDSTGNWILVDQTRGEDKAVYPNQDISESSASFTWVDFVSNGFKIRSNITAVNANGGEYIYAAFSENAFSLNGGLAR